MTDDDFEKRLAAMFREQVDHEAGPRRSAPPLARPGRLRHHRRAPWVTPLLAAACVVAVVAGGYGVSTLVSQRDDTPAEPTPSLVHPQPMRTTPATAVPTTTPAPSRSATPTASTTATVTKPGRRTSTTAHPSHAGTSTRAARSSSPSSDLTYVRVSGAVVAVPSGWTLSLNHDSSSGEDFWETSYCLNRKEASPAEPCAIQIARIHPPTGTAGRFPQLDVDRTAFGQGNAPQYLCGSGTDTVAEQFGSRDFGGRSAEYRLWTRSCHGTVVTHEIQEVAIGAPAWGLSMTDPQNGDGRDWQTYLSAFDAVAHESTLPGASGGYRYMDRGTLASVTRTAGGARVGIDRKIRQLGADSVSYADDDGSGLVYYTVPTALYDQAKVHRGSAVYLATDAHRVIDFIDDSVY